MPYKHYKIGFKTLDNQIVCTQLLKQKGIGWSGDGIETVDCWALFGSLGGAADLIHLFSS